MTVGRYRDHKKVLLIKFRELSSRLHAWGKPIIVGFSHSRGKVSYVPSHSFRLQSFKGKISLFPLFNYQSYTILGIPRVIIGVFKTLRSHYLEFYPIHNTNREKK